MTEEKGTIRRTSDGVPIYDGTAEHFLLFKEECYKYVLSFERHKRYLAGPRIVTELQGLAKAVVRRPLAQNPMWVDHPGGVKTLLDFLEANLERPSLVNASRYVNKFFFSLKRKRMETMTAWINRHSEALWEANKAMKRVQDEYGMSDQAMSSRSHSSNTRHGSSIPDDDVEARSTPCPWDDDGRLREDGESEEPNSNALRRNSWWSSEGWSWSQGQGRWVWSDWSDDAIPAFDEVTNETFLPDFLVGYLLLNRSGLDYAERNNVLANIRGRFSVRTVEKALRDLWSDEDIYRRDKAKGHALFAEDFPENGEDENAYVAESMPDFGEDWERHEAYLAAEQTAFEAQEQIQESRRTLREARQKQHDLRLGRQYYQSTGKGKGHSKSWGKGGKGKASNKSSSIVCVRCGGDHYASQCPNTPSNPEKSMIAEEAAEIAFHAQHFAGTAEAEEASLLAVKDLILQGKGILDCGATSSLGSVEAVESLMRLNCEKGGNHQVEVDLQNRPTFRFGNGHRKTCLSTAKVAMKLGGKAGNMEVHVHDAANQPILISVKALKSLGAVVDFKTGHCIFQTVNPKKVIQLTEEENGHLTMPLTGDLLKGAESRGTDFPGLFAE